MIQNNYLTAFKLSILFFAILGLATACSGNRIEATPKLNENPSPTSAQVAAEKVDPTASVAPTDEPAPSLEPSATAEPTSDISPTELVDSEEQTVSEGLALMEERCIECHNLSRVTSKSKTLEEWRRTVERMVDKGTVLSEAEQETLIDYLAETYP
jgi:cytochrome c-type biogenesis protein CcmH/NrfF